MSKIVCSKKYVGDIGISRELESIGNNEKCEELDLSYNHLSSVPDLRKYRQFDNLKVLVLSGNHIRHIDVSLIPPTLTELNLFGNELTTIGAIYLIVQS